MEVTAKLTFLCVLAAVDARHILEQGSPTSRQAPPELQKLLQAARSAVYNTNVEHHSTKTTQGEDGIRDDIPLNGEENTEDIDVPVDFSSGRDEQSKDEYFSSQPTPADFTYHYENREGIDVQECPKDHVRCGDDKCCKILEI